MLQETSAIVLSPMEIQHRHSASTPSTISGSSIKRVIAMEQQGKGDDDSVSSSTPQQGRNNSGSSGGGNQATATTATASSSYSTPHYILFPIFILLNITTMSDRGIIPGASREFSAFVVAAYDSPDLVRHSPDAGLGLLQAAFIGGYSVAILISGHLVHKIPWKILVTTGWAVWIVAVAASGFSRSVNSFYLLLLSRMTTGVSEASFHVVAAPIIQDRGGSYAGLWLSLYLTGVPIGLAVGYVYGSLIANHSQLGWQWAFYFECLLSIPLLVACLLVRDAVNGGILSSTSSSSSAGEALVPLREADAMEEERSVPSSDVVERTRSRSSTPRDVTHHVTFWEEVKACMSSKVLVCLIIANAALIAVVATLGTFGGAFILALSLFDSEETGAVLFGLCAATAGIIGTPLGGNFVDRILARHSHGASDMEILTSLLPEVNKLIIIGTIFCWPTLLVRSPVFFLGFLFLGWLFLFASNSGITMAILLSVKPRYRSNAVAFSTLMTHVLGDVPAPILFGALKDHLAPACSVNAEGEFEDLEKCQEQHIGLRQTLAVAYAWMIWCIVFFEVARRYAKQETKREHREDRDVVFV